MLKKLFFLGVAFKNSFKNGLKNRAVKTAVAILVLYGAFFLSLLCIAPVFAVLTETPSPSESPSPEPPSPSDRVAKASMCTVCSTVSGVCFCDCRSIIIKNVFFGLVASFISEWNQQVKNGKQACVVFGSAGIKIYNGDFDFSDLNDIDVLVEDDESAKKLFAFVNDEIQGVMYSLLGGTNDKGWISFDIKCRSADSGGGYVSGKAPKPKVRAIILKENDTDLCAFEIVIKPDWMKEELDYYQVDFNFPEGLVINDKKRVSLNLLTEKSYVLLDQMTLDMEIDALAAFGKGAGDVAAVDLDPELLIYICKTLYKVNLHQNFYEEIIAAFKKTPHSDSDGHLFIAEEDVEKLKDKLNNVLKELKRHDGFLGFIYQELFSFNFPFSIVHGKCKSIDDDNQGDPEEENLRKMKLALSKRFLIGEESGAEGKGLFDFFCQSVTLDVVSKIMLLNISMQICFPEINEWKQISFFSDSKNISMDQLEAINNDWYCFVEGVIKRKCEIGTKEFNFYMQELARLKELAGLPCFSCNTFCHCDNAFDSSQCKEIFNNDFVRKVCPAVLGAGLSVVVFFYGAGNKDMHFVVIDYNSIKKAGFDNLITMIESETSGKYIIKKHPDSFESIVFFSSSVDGGWFECKPKSFLAKKIEFLIAGREIFLSNNKFKFSGKEFLKSANVSIAGKSGKEIKVPLVMTCISGKMNLKRVRKACNAWQEFIDCCLEKLGAGVLLSIDEFSIKKMGEHAVKSGGGKNKKKHKKNKEHCLDASNKKSNDGSVSEVMETGPTGPTGAVDLNLTGEGKRIKELEVNSVDECCDLFKNIDLVAVDKEGDKAERNHGLFYTDFSTSDGNVRALVNRKESESLATTTATTKSLYRKKNKKKKAGVNEKKENEEPINSSSEPNQKQRVSAAVKKAIKYFDMHRTNSPFNVLRVENWRPLFNRSKVSCLEREERIKKELIEVVLEAVGCAHLKENTEKVNIIVVDLSHCNDEVIIDALCVAEALHDPVAQLILGWVRVAQSEQMNQKEKYSTFIDAGSLFKNAYFNGNIQGLYSLYWLAEFTGYAEFFSGSIFSVKGGDCFVPLSTEIPIIRFLLPGNSSLLNKQYRSNAIIPIKIIRDRLSEIGEGCQETEIDNITSYLDKTLCFNDDLASKLKATLLYSDEHGIPKKDLDDILINRAHQACFFMSKNVDLCFLFEMSELGFFLNREDPAILKEMIEKLSPAFVSYIMLDREKLEKNKGILKAAGSASVYYTSFFCYFLRKYIEKYSWPNCSNDDIKYIYEFVFDDNDGLYSRSSYLYHAFSVIQTVFKNNMLPISATAYFIDLCQEHWGLQVASYQDFIDRLAMIKGFFHGDKSDRVKIINHKIDFVVKKYITIDARGEHFYGAEVMGSNRKASYIDVKNGSYDFRDELISDMSALIKGFYDNIILALHKQQKTRGKSDAKKADSYSESIDSWYQKINSMLNKLIYACQTMAVNKYSKAPAAKRTGCYNGSVKRVCKVYLLLEDLMDGLFCTQNFVKLNFDFARIFYDVSRYFFNQSIFDGVYDYGIIENYSDNKKKVACKKKRFKCAFLSLLNCTCYKGHESCRFSYPYNNSCNEVALHLDLFKSLSLNYYALLCGDDFLKVNDAFIFLNLFDKASFHVDNYDCFSCVFDVIFNFFIKDGVLSLIYRKITDEDKGGDGSEDGKILHEDDDSFAVKKKEVMEELNSFLEGALKVAYFLISRDVDFCKRGGEFKKIVGLLDKVDVSQSEYESIKRLKKEWESIVDKHTKELDELYSRKFNDAVASLEGEVSLDKGKGEVKTHAKKKRNKKPGLVNAVKKATDCQFQDNVRKKEIPCEQESEINKFMQKIWSLSEQGKYDDAISKIEIEIERFTQSVKLSSSDLVKLRLIVFEIKMKKTKEKWQWGALIKKLEINRKQAAGYFNQYQKALKSLLNCDSDMARKRTKLVDKKDFLNFCISANQELSDFFEKSDFLEKLRTELYDLIDEVIALKGSSNKDDDVEYFLLSTSCEMYGDLKRGVDSICNICESLLHALKMRSSWLEKLREVKKEAAASKEGQDFIQNHGEETSCAITAKEAIDMLEKMQKNAGKVKNNISNVEERINSISDPGREASFTNRQLKL